MHAYIHTYMHACIHTYIHPYIHAYIPGKVANTVKALWTVPSSQISKEEHTEFYRFISKAWDEPRYTIQLNTDAPIAVRSILYIPTVCLSACLSACLSVCLFFVYKVHID